MKWIKGAGFYKEPEGINQEVAEALVPRFELFFALGGMISADDFNEMNETEIRACSIARAIHDSRITKILEEKRAEVRNKMAIEEAAAKVADRLINSRGGS